MNPSESEPSGDPAASLLVAGSAAGRPWGQEEPGGGAPGRRPGLIVALDDPDLDRAVALAAELAGLASALKVGLTLFAAHGPRAIRAIGPHAPVFCDLKLHDIPEQVRRAVEVLGAEGAWMLTVHASGGSRMLAAAVEAAAGFDAPPLVAAVTVLTSLAPQQLAAVGQGSDPGAQVSRLAHLAAEAGAPALVCSPLELARLRAQLGPEVVLVAPGIRSAGAALGDQARVTDPGAAARARADYVVVGRPITEAPDPAAAAARIVEELGA